VTPVQRLLKAIDAAADNPNANLNKLADQIEGALNLPNNSLSFAWDPVLEDFQIRFAYQQNITVCPAPATRRPVSCGGVSEACLACLAMALLHTCCRHTAGHQPKL
jgi:hypothetical protein